MPPSTILIIDDDRLTRWSIARQLSRAGYGVAEAASGEEGLEHIRTVRPDLVLLDLDLPGMDGFGVLAALRATHPTVPVLTMTTDSTTLVAQRVRALGAAAHLEKPLDIPNLLSAIGESLRLPTA